MKRVYEKPYALVENYELSSNIASNCAMTVTMGPEGPSAIKVCDDYYDKTGEVRPKSRARSLPHNVQFWTEENCNCYYSAGGSGCFTS